MSDTSRDSESLLALVADCLGRLVLEGEAAVDDLCAAHPEHAPALREHLQRMRSLGLLGRADLSLTLREHGAGLDPESPTDRAPTGSRIGSHRYVLKGELARGGMGVILRVFDRDLRRHLAMKVALVPGAPIGTKGEIDPATLGRFLEEAQVTGQLEHPGIVPVHELGVDADGRVYFTMRLVQGETFREVIEHVHDGVGGWTRTRALGVLAKVCEAVAYAHEKRILHRDLKPANIMVGRFGETYVMDWGLARVLGRDDDQGARLQPIDATLTGIRTDRAEAAAADADSPLVTRDGSVVGTPAYMPPEQAEGRVEELRPSADVYAVGAMLYHLLCGHAPYVPLGKGPSPREVLQHVVRGPPSPIESEAKDVPPEIAAICQRAMARDPSERYPDMGALSDDVRAFLEGRVVLAHRTGAVAELRKWVVRNRAVAATLAAALLGLSAVVAWSHGRIRDERNVALANEAAAEDERERADAQREQVLRLSDVLRLRQLVEEEGALWPPTPDRVEAMSDWLREVRALTGKLDGHRATLAALPEADGDVAVEWQRSVLHDLIAGLEHLLADDAHTATLASVERRRAFAASVVARTVDGEREAWDAAVRSIADEVECPAYEGLRIAPQVGLVPLGRDRRSGLWEFWHVQTGARPAWIDGGIPSLTEDAGVVLILLPGGVLQRELEAPDEGVELLPVEPFFLAKHELTQAQWMRAFGANPSYFPAGTRPGGHAITGLHPVERIDWADASEFARRTGLALPTEVEWEYGARAGTETPWWSGSDPRSLDRVGNLADSSVGRFGGAWRFDETLDDDHAVHAPIGTYLPNRFGLHDTIGNVAEWCADVVDVPSVGEHERDARPLRGGSYRVLPDRARADLRAWDHADVRSQLAGVRLARPLER